MQIGIDDFLQLRKQLPVVDVRSEGEYQEGHVASAFNIPLLNNAERAVVGTESEKVGNELLVHCWRGGMRSSNFCQFVGMSKVKTHQLVGGYKAYRHRALESFKSPFNLLVVGGCTGSGKSEILHALKKNGEQVIDLEGLANHKGSAFGALMMPPQPTTEQFQNDLFEEIQTLDLSKRIWIEDESISIGKIILPEDFWRMMMAS